MMTEPKRRRRYRLTPAGLASLRAANARVRPWERSTGPRTAAGKARARMNALRHGERSAAQRQARAEERLLLRASRAEDRAAVEELTLPSRVEVWIRRLARETGVP